MHDHAVGHLGDRAHVVGDQHDRSALVVAQFSQQVEDLRLHGDVERGGRLVGDQDFGLAGERHRDHHALAHAAGELVRIFVDAPVRAPGMRTARSISIGARARRRAPAFVQAHRLGDLFADA